MSDTFDPDERFSLDEDPEDVLRKLLGTEDDEDSVQDAAEDEPT
jgi:hypothetical protein